jgi:hypothetical protein
MKDNLSIHTSPLPEEWLREIIPRQHTGGHSKTKSTISLKTPEEALSRYQTAAKRLLEVNQWHEYAGKGTALFQLTDSTANPVFRPVAKGDYFRIDIPGPGSKAGEGKDWVKVKVKGEKNHGDNQLTHITVCTSGHPLKMQEYTAHFFDTAATSTFFVMRQNLTITVAVYGRNERPNIQTRSLWDRIRNILVYIGAQFGISNIQWKSLTEGLLG